MKPHKIHSISSLRQRRKELEMEIEVTRQAIEHSVKKTEYSTRSFFIKSVLVPLGAGGLAALLFRKESFQEDERPAWVIFLQKLTDMVNQKFAPEEEQEEAAPREEASAATEESAD